MADDSEDKVKEVIPEDNQGGRRLPGPKDYRKLGYDMHGNIYPYRHTNKSGTEVEK
jgi:hypothetical protein